MLPRRPPCLLALAASLFLTPLKAVVPSACRALLQVATSASQRRALHSLGCAIGDAELLSSLAAELVADSVGPLAPADRTQSGCAARVGEAAVGVAALSPSGTDAMAGGVEDTASDTALGGMSSATGPMATGAAAAAATAQAAQAAKTAVTAQAHAAAEADEPGCAEVCTAIGRRFGCGIDDELDASGRAALAQLRGVTMRSIQRLAAELYGGNAHFLLELVQVERSSRWQIGSIGSRWQVEGGRWQV